MSHVPACRCSFCRQYVSGFVTFAMGFPFFADPTMPMGRIDFRQHGRTVASIINVASLTLPKPMGIITAIEPDEQDLDLMRRAQASADAQE